jgi:hypothetical protein
MSNKKKYKAILTDYKRMDHQTSFTFETWDFNFNELFNCLKDKLNNYHAPEIVVYFKQFDNDYLIIDVKDCYKQLHTFFMYNTINEMFILGRYVTTAIDTLVLCNMKKVYNMKTTAIKTYKFDNELRQYKEC